MLCYVERTAWLYVCLSIWIAMAVRAWTISRHATHPFLLPETQRFVPCCLGAYRLYECTFPDMSAAAPVNVNTSCPWGCRRCDVICDSLDAIIPVQSPSPRLIDIVGAVIACIAVFGAVFSGTWLAAIVVATLVGKREAVDNCHVRLLSVFR